MYSCLRPDVLASPPLSLGHSQPSIITPFSSLPSPVVSLPSFKTSVYTCQLPGVLMLFSSLSFPDSLNYLVHVFARYNITGLAAAVKIFVLSFIGIFHFLSPYLI